MCSHHLPLVIEDKRTTDEAVNLTVDFKSFFSPFPFQPSHLVEKHSFKLASTVKLNPQKKFCQPFSVTWTDFPHSMALGFLSKDIQREQQHLPLVHTVSLKPEICVLTHSREKRSFPTTALISQCLPHGLPSLRVLLQAKSDGYQFLLLKLKV